MKYVGVKHKPEHTKLYWFAVPDGLAPHVGVGSEVLCDTRKGHNKGIVQIVLDGVSEDEMLRVAQFNRQYLPVKNIISVALDAELGEIHIPYFMENTPPTPEKIAKRVSEFYELGRFDTPVIFTQDMNLQDGYTAYLVATMFGQETLHGFCVSL